MGEAKRRKKLDPNYGKKIVDYGKSVVKEGNTPTIIDEHEVKLTGKSKPERKKVGAGRLKGQYFVLPDEVGETYYTLYDLIQTTKRWIINKYFPPHDALLLNGPVTNPRERRLWYKETIDQNQWIKDNYGFVYGGENYEETRSGKECLIFYARPGIKTAMAVKTKKGWIPKVKMGKNWCNLRGVESQSTADEALELALIYPVQTYDEYMKSL
jgi:hypothetical protein